MRKVCSLSAMIGSVVLFYGNWNLASAQDKNPVAQGGSCASPDGSFFGTTLISGGSITYDIANSNGLCYNNLNPGQTYCWTYLYPNSGSFYLQITVNQSCGNCDGTSFISTTACVMGCSSTGIGCGSIQYNSSCAVQQSGGIEVGNGCTPAQACGTVFTFCITVPAGCSTMDVCPMVQCTGDPGNCVGLMPIELLSFTGKNACEKNILAWTSVSEKDNSYYTLEKSADGENYSALAIIPGAGNSSVPLDYELSDAQTETSEINYYRLKQTDYDGKSTTFNTIALRRKCDNTLIVQDFTRENVVILSNNQPGVAALYDIFGRKIITEIIPASASETTLELAAYAKGIYLLEIISGNEKISRKILIQ